MGFARAIRWPAGVSNKAPRQPATIGATGDLVWAGARRLVFKDRGKTMLKLIEDLPPTVLGVEASGKVTHEDYQNILIPNAEAMMAKGPINMHWRRFHRL